MIRHISVYEDIVNSRLRLGLAAEIEIPMQVGKTLELCMSLGFSVYGAVSRRKSVLLATLLVLVPPWAFAVFNYVKYWILDDHGSRGSKSQQ